MFIRSLLRFMQSVSTGRANRTPTMDICPLGQL